jgi:hypothetical protein
MQPGYIERSARPGITLKAALDGSLLAALLGVSLLITLLEAHGYVVITIPIVLTTIVLVLLFTMLVSFLVISGDLYMQSQDEFQRATRGSASVITLRVVSVLLLVLCIGYICAPAWRTVAPVHLSILICIARITYLCTLASLRWQALAEVDLADENRWTTAKS